MKQNYEEQEKIRKLNYIKQVVVGLLDNSKTGHSENLLKDLREQLKPILEKNGFDKVRDELNVSAFEIIDGIKDYSDEIIFAIDTEIESLDPSSQHKLFLKKISSMTGYEYQRYLRLINQ